VWTVSLLSDRTIGDTMSMGSVLTYMLERMELKVDSGVGGVS